MMIIAIHLSHRENTSACPSPNATRQAVKRLDFATKLPLFIASTMGYFIAAISNSGGAPEQAYRKMQAAGACPEKPFAGKSL